MSQFYVTFEDSEDTFGTTDNLADAIATAREAVLDAQVGDVVSIELDGVNIRQFVLRPDRSVEEIQMDSLAPRSTLAPRRSA